MRVYKKNDLNFYMRTLAIMALLLCFNLESMAQQAKSDYEIQQNFKEQYKEISNKLTSADSSAYIEELVVKVKDMENTYSEHQELLDVALYPETFESEMEDLKRRALAAKSQLATIEQQKQKLQELSQQVTSYDSRLETLNSRTDSLRNTIQKSIKSEEQLTGMVRRYRESLEQRDELILSFVDSVMITYEKLNIESMQDLENAKKKARFNADGNALKMILNIANENIALLESDQDLTTENYLRMSSVQQEFKSMWNKVGDKLVDIYAEGDTEKAKENISKAIADWDKKVTKQTWTSLNNSFDSAGIQLPKFADQETFYQTLNSYLNESISSSKEGEETLDSYRNFNTFWTNRVQSNWAPYITDANVLSNQQIATVDQKLDEWGTNVEPESNMLVYLLGFSLIAIIALGVMLAREKKDTKA